jgi:hypothetical protein
MENISKIINFIVYYLIRLFGIIVFLIGIFLILYYITPNNFTLISNVDSKLKFIEMNTLNLLPNSQHVYEHNNNYLKFNKEIEIIIGNNLKTQKIIIEPTKLIKINENSKLIILNNSAENMIIEISEFI